MAENLMPIMLRIAGKKCVVIGGGEVAAQKVNQLLECSASIFVVSPKLCINLAELAKQGRIQ